MITIASISIAYSRVEHILVLPWTYTRILVILKLKWHEELVLLNYDLLYHVKSDKWHKFRLFLHENGCQLATEKNGKLLSDMLFKMLNQNTF